MLQNTNVSAAIVGASRPEQVTENVKAAGVRLDADAMKRIDEALDGVVQRDPAKTRSPGRARLRLIVRRRPVGRGVQAHRSVDLAVALEEA